MGYDGINSKQIEDLTPCRATSETLMVGIGYPRSWSIRMTALGDVVFQNAWA